MQVAAQPIKNLETAVIKLSQLFENPANLNSIHSKSEAKNIFCSYGLHLPQDKIKKLFESGIISKKEMELASFLASCKSHNIYTLDVYIRQEKSATCLILEATIGGKPISFLESYPKESGKAINPVKLVFLTARKYPLLDEFILTYKANY